MAPSKRLPQPRPWGIVLMAFGWTACALALTWRHWASPVVDFGRELYAAWQLNQGAVLHRDIAWFNGPLSAWWNGFWFNRLEDGLLGMVGLNAVLFLLFLLIACWLVAQAFDRTAAATTAFVVPFVFGMGQPLGVGIFSFLTPYSHELTHGALLGLACLAATYRGRMVHWTWTLAGGFALGLAFLTKPEVFVATLAGWLALVLALPRSAGWSQRLLQALAGLAVASLPVALAYLRLRTHLAPDLAYSALLGAWPYATDERVRELPFYANLSGLVAPTAYLRAMALALVRYALYAALWIGVGRWINRTRGVHP